MWFSLGEQFYSPVFLQRRIPACLLCAWFWVSFAEAGMEDGLKQCNNRLSEGILVSLLLFLGHAEMKDQFLLECLISNPLSMIRGPVHKTSMKLLPHATHHVYSIAPNMVHVLFNETSPLTTHFAIVAMASCYKCFYMLTLHICTLMSQDNNGS